MRLLFTILLILLLLAAVAAPCVAAALGLLSPHVVLAGLIGGALIGGITVLCVFLFYRKKRHGASYPLDRYASMDLTDSEDRFVGSYDTRVRIQNNSNKRN